MRHMLTTAQYTSFDHVDRFPAALKYLGEGLQDGTLKRKFHVVEGLENAPSAMNLLFTGGNTGKLFVPQASDGSVDADGCRQCRESSARRKREALRL